MNADRWVKERFKDALRRSGRELVPASLLYEWQRGGKPAPWRSNCALPKDSARYLKPDSPRLLELKRRYQGFDPSVTAPFAWTEAHLKPEDVAYFRGDTAWLWQVRGKNANVMAYALSYYYLKSRDRLNLFDQPTEDDSFGCVTFEIGGTKISRDLLDSVGEIDFLDRHLGLASWNDIRILDIGAGYGRLAHRMVTALLGIAEYLCTDGVATSSFVSDYYLRWRGNSRARAVPLDEIEAALNGRQIDLAVNIHSFSECRLDAIEWWLRLLSKNRVRYLLIVPNDWENLVTSEGHDFLPLLERYGYRLKIKEPKYRDPVVQQYGLLPSWYHLLERRS